MADNRGIFGGIMKVTAIRVFGENEVFSKEMSFRKGNTLITRAFSALCAEFLGG